MPGFNQKGPTGQGPMTGRKMGKCTNFGAGKRDSAEKAEYENFNADKEQGMGRGRGLGLGRCLRGRGRGQGRGQR
ncbi:MAG: DUF5320 domain-containing protein [Paludibacteraceae bacterium]|jgi:hypothetical protein|nr:DUF5320 domain-containing protein [Paludibacteraceae bacterium]OQC34337.1 MAG: hypothetical protein BWX65_00446 [Bacteroidetes bacterium ADurb.Bin057]HHT60790.1 DUF5320 domain-containing protein [Bacteroidales bacterium]MBP9040004.1 DUF5320 domain-containing protein [Paludibacteraceae bacterium]HOG36394.1 DUF5320 domain-containing protein [Paludibacteraceae bacterium]